MKPLSYKLNLIQLVFLLQALFCLVSTQTINLDFTEQQSFNIKQLQKYELSVTENVNKYVLIQVEGSEGKNNYVLSAYDSDKKTPRIQLAQSFNGVSKLYISKKYFNTQIFLDLECSDYNSCSGTIKAEEFVKIPLYDGEQISYYINGPEETIEFVLNCDSPISNVWARGQLKISTSLNIDIDNKKKYNENYYIVEQSMTDVDFSVKGQFGDYINVGLIGYTKNRFSDTESDKESDIVSDIEPDKEFDENVYYKPNSNI